MRFLVAPFIAAIFTLLISGLVCAGEQQSSLSLPAPLLINIEYVGGFIEFKVHDGTVMVTAEGEKVEVVEDGRTRYIIFTDNFHKLYLEELSYAEMGKKAFSAKKVKLDRSGDKVAAITNVRDNPEMIIVDRKDGNVILKVPVEETPEDLAWSPDSSCVALLSKSDRPGLWPWELLWGLAGHPVSYYTYYLDVYDTSGRLLFEHEFEDSYKFGVGRLAWDSEDKAADTGSAK